MPNLFFSVPAKTILFGEHAVVYGSAAIAVPINSLSLKITIAPNIENGKKLIIDRNSGKRHIFSELNAQNPLDSAIQTIKKNLNLDQLPAFKIEISSTIPVASGLGSSAAFSVCLTKALSAFLGFNLSLERINEIAYEIERLHHGTPSGIDNTVIAFNKPILFRKDQAASVIRLEKPLTLIIGDTGIQSKTSEVVKDMRVKRDESPESVNPFFNRIDTISIEAVEYLKTGSLAGVGKLMSENHELLRQLGVSCPELDLLVKAAISAGALGAKLCGSGRGGNMVALVTPEKVNQIESAITRAGASHCYIATIKEG